MALLVPASLKLSPSLIEIQSQLDRNSCTLKIANGVLIENRRFYYNVGSCVRYIVCLKMETLSFAPISS
jgi:hypothetical protein